MNAETPLKDLIAQLRALKEKATPGRRYLNPSNEDAPYGWQPRLHGGDGVNEKLIAVFGNAECPIEAQEEWEANAAIAEALDPATVDRLLDVAEAAVELAEAVKPFARIGATKDACPPQYADDTAIQMTCDVTQSELEGFQAEYDELEKSGKQIYGERPGPLSMPKHVVSFDSVEMGDLRKIATALGAFDKATEGK